MTIGTILPFFTNPSYVERLRGVESVLSDSEYDLILFNAETPERRDEYFMHVPRRERVDGLLVMTHVPTEVEARRLLEARIPTVLIDSYHSDFTHVGIDNVAGGYCATRHLIELGHRKIGFISDFLESEFDFRPIRDRYLGYYQALEEYDVPYRADYHQQGPHGRFEAWQMAHDLLSMDDRPTAIFAYSDTQAIGVLEAARDLGLPVPEALSVIGFDDIEVAEFWHLTTVRQPLFESGVQASKLLLEEIALAPPAPREIILPTSLIVRATTGPPAC